MYIVIYSTSYSNIRTNFILFEAFASRFAALPYLIELTMIVVKCPLKLEWTQFRFYDKPQKQGTIDLHYFRRLSLSNSWFDCGREQNTR